MLTAANYIQTIGHRLLTDETETYEFIHYLKVNDSINFDSMSLVNPFSDKETLRLNIGSICRTFTYLGSDNEIVHTGIFLVSENEKSEISSLYLYHDEPLTNAQKTDITDKLKLRIINITDNLIRLIT